MQITIKIVTKKIKSLRKSIYSDKKISDYDFYVNQIKDGSGSNQWSKIKHKNVTGVINIDWDASERTLTARCIGDDPTEILGKFIWYINSRFQKSVSFITIHK
jgi:hypothetical protein